MGLNHSPRIVTNGLVLCLDAANRKSYPGSGTTWTDLSGNGNNGTLTNGPTFSGANGGSLVFDGTNDEISSFPTQISGTGSKTVCCLFKTTNTTRTSIIETRNYGVTGWAFFINLTNTGTLAYSHIGIGNIISAADIISTNVWYHACVTYDLAITTATLYLNGKILGSPTSLSNSLASASNGSIGKPDSGNTPSYFQGNISQVSIYNRALSAAEIQQNFNALRGRYGI